MSGANPEPLAPEFWTALEKVPGGTALPTIWRRQLKAFGDFEVFSRLFLRPRDEAPAAFVPCPWNCGCSHKVVPRDNGTLAGICQCSPPHCGEYTVVPEERISWELDWARLGRELCRVFGMEFKIAKLGLFNALQVGSWSLRPVGAPGLQRVEAILFIPSSDREFLHAVTMLVARLGRPFILFAPTNKYYGSAAKEVLGNLGAAFFALDAHIGLDPKSGQFAAMNGETGEELFAEVVPEIQELPETDLAGRVCVVVEGLDSGSRRKNPSLAAVFRLYFVQGLPVAQVARKCRCSVGTIVNRLKLLEAKTGATPEQLLRIAPQFEQFYGDLTAAKGEYVRSRIKRKPLNL
jgi:hypothetical protein